MKLSSRLPWYGLLAAVVLVPLVVGTTPLGGMRLTLNIFVQAKLLVLALALAHMLGTWAVTTLREHELYSGRALIPLGAFALAAAIATATALDPRMAFFGDSEQGVGLLVFLMCLAIGYLTSQLVRDGHRMDELTTAFVVTGALVALTGLSQQLFGFDPTGTTPFGSPTTFAIRRGFGTIGNADTFSAFLVLPAFLAAGKFLRASERTERLLWGGSLVAILLSCVAAQTRGPLLGILVGAVVYVVRARKAKPTSKTAARIKHARAADSWAGLLSTALIVAGAVIAGLFVAAVLANGDITASWIDFTARFANLKDAASLGGRLPLWDTAVRMAAAHPLFGVGPDSFRLGWYGLRSAEHLSKGVGLVITDPHDVPLLIAATMGLIGALAAAYLLGASVWTGFKVASSNQRSPEYEAWLAGTIALSVTLLSSMLASVLLFSLMLAIGVLIAPSLHPAGTPRFGRLGVTALQAAAVAAALALLGFSVFGARAQLIAASAQGAEPVQAQPLIEQASSVAPWDTQLRKMRYDTLVQSALQQVFAGAPNASATVDAAAAQLVAAAQAEPHDYFYRYQNALVLIGSGQRLGDTYTSRGIEAGLEAIRIYPNALELRTGIATGYLQLNEPAKAANILSMLWDADPAYPTSGVTYAKALLADKKPEAARAVVSVLVRRFPDDPSVAELATQIPSR